MANWTNDDFNAEAAKIAGAFRAGQGQNGASLDDLVTKSASDANLNAEQISRLARLVNVITFEDKFASMQGDRNVEFALASDQEVCRRLQTQAAPKTAGVRDLYPELRFTSEEEDAAHRSIKTASAEGAAHRACSFFPKAPPLDVQYEAEKRAARRDEELAKQAEVAWHLAMEPVVEQLRRRGADHDQFEKDALVTLGHDALYELNVVREERGMEPLSIEREKVAEVVERVEGRETTLTRQVKKAVQERTKCAQRVASAAEHAKNRDALKARLKEALRG